MKTDPFTWKFEEDPDVICFSIRPIMEGREPVLHVVHDRDDISAWQFLGLETPDQKDGVIISIGWMIDHDPSIATLHDLPVDWHAWRATPDDEWYREPL